MLHVNILTRYRHRLFDQQIDRQRFDEHISFQENSTEVREWDCVVVFDGVPDKVTLKVTNGALLFVAGEPPDAMTYTRQFLGQFDRTYCAHPGARGLPTNKADQYFNNWHFGYDPSQNSFRYGFDQVRTLALPEKKKNLSVIMSSLAYMPSHLKRLRFLQALKEQFGDQVDVYGRGHRFIPYKEDAILPYRFHLCIENCEVLDLWTEKIADPILGYAVPVYAGCPNISKYFPEQSMIRLDINDPQSSLATIARILASPETEYRRRLPGVQAARSLLIGKYNLTSLVAEFLELRGPQTQDVTMRELVPNEQTLTYPIQNTFLRGRRLVYRKFFQLTHHHRLYPKAN